VACLLLSSSLDSFYRRLLGGFLEVSWRLLGGFLEVSWRFLGEP